MPKSTAGKLDAINLKAALWDTLQKVRSGKMTPGAGDVVASQAREILRTVRTQLAVFSQSGEGVSSEIVDFARPMEAKLAKSVSRAVGRAPKSRDAVK